MQTLNRPNCEAIRSIPENLDNELFSAADILKLFLDDGKNNSYYGAYKGNLWRWARHHGIVTNPDNARTNENGAVLVGVDGSVLLEDGHKYSKWFGKTWKKKLFEYEDSIQIKQGSNPDKEPEPEKERELSCLSLLVAFYRAKAISFKRLCSVAAFVLIGGILFSFAIHETALDVYRLKGPKAAINAYLGRNLALNDLVDLGFYYKDNDQVDLAIKTIQKALDSNDLLARGRALSLLVNINIEQNKFDEAIGFFDQAREIFIEMDRPQNLAYIYLSMSSLYVLQKDFDSALNMIQSAENIYGPSMAVVMAKSLCFYESGDYSMAIEHALQANQSGNVADIIESCIILSGSYLRLGDMTSALYYINMADSYIHETDHAVLKHYSFVQRIHLAKCMGVDSNRLVSIVLNYAHESGDIELVKGLNSYPCD